MPVETRNGKRVILKEHPVEGPLLKRIFELRAAGILHDKEIIDEVNRLGFKTRIHYIRSKYDRTKVVGKRGGKPVRTVFDGLVSIDTFNKANRGKVVIIDNGEDITITTEMAPAHQVNKGMRNPEFPTVNS
jgi:site-specific DNA recombinase